MPLYKSFRDSFHKSFYRATADENIIGAPVVCCFAQADFLKTVQTERPQNVFFRLDAHLNVLDDSGCAFAPLCDCLVASDCFVPVLYVENEQTVAALSDFVFENRIGDAAVCAPYAKRHLLPEAHRQMPLARLMMDCRALDDIQNLNMLAGDAWESHALTVLLGEQACTRQTVAALQRRMLNVFCQCSQTELPRIILTGVNGVVCDRPSLVYGTFDRFPEGSLTRRVQFYAHKGYQNEGEFAENTITAVKMAQSVRVDAAEIDIKLSADGVPVLMHNMRTTDMCVGEPRVIEEMTYAELRRAERTRYPDEYIDSLDDTYAAVQGDPDFSLLVEFKSSDGYQHLEELMDHTKGLIEKYDMEHQTMLMLCESAPYVDYAQRVLPRIPKTIGLWAPIKSPNDQKTIENMIYDECVRLRSKCGIPTLEDVMVNRAFAEQIKMRGLLPVTWMRGDYHHPSQWEDACHRADEAVVSGYYATVTDHAARYFHLPVELCYDEQSGVCARLRNGERTTAENAFLVDLGDAYAAYALELTLPTGLPYVIFTDAFKK